MHGNSDPYFRPDDEIQDICPEDDYENEVDYSEYTTEELCEMGDGLMDD